MLSRHKENNKVDPQSSNKQPSSHIRTDFAAAFGVADFEVGVSVNEGGHQVHVNAEVRIRYIVCNCLYLIHYVCIKNHKNMYQHI